MKFFRWYFVLPLLLALACTSAPPAGNPSADQLLLYEISGNGLQESSFIFGTLHFIPSDLFLVPEALSTRLKESDALVLEANIDIPLMDQIAIAQRTLLPSQHSLRDYLPPDKYEESIRYMIDSLGISEKKANRYMYMKPVYLLAPLLMEYYGSVESYEKEFIKMAKKEDKQLLFLEEISFQLDLLDSIPLEVQLEDFSVANFIKEY